MKKYEVGQASKIKSLNSVNSEVLDLLSSVLWEDLEMVGPLPVHHGEESEGKTGRK